jgi:NADH-quinone oxidoreductase subunit C
MLLCEIAKILNDKFSGVVLEEQKNALLIKRESLLSVARFLKDGQLAFDNLHCISGFDRKDRIEGVYIFYSFSRKLTLILKISAPMDDLTVESLAHLWKSADWLERETYDFYGIKFLNHPDLRRIMNPDSWTDFPLRKDFARADFIKKPQTLGLKGA